MLDINKFKYFFQILLDLFIVGFLNFLLITSNYILTLKYSYVYNSINNLIQEKRPNSKRLVYILKKNLFLVIDSLFIIIINRINDTST